MPALLRGLPTVFPSSWKADQLTLTLFSQGVYTEERLLGGPNHYLVTSEVWRRTSSHMWPWRTHVALAQPPAGGGGQQWPAQLPPLPYPGLRGPGGHVGIQGRHGR